MNMKPADSKKLYFITGAAGFIGYFLSRKLLEQDCKVIGLDNLNDYYNVTLKYERLKQLQQYGKFIFHKVDISHKSMIFSLFQEYRPDVVFNLAAQAGVRYSIENPDAYIQSNIIGFFNILEACRAYSVEHLIYASSSSVYGSNSQVPFKETDMVDHPVSLYAATKKSNELMAHTYSHLYHIPITGLRFFTVYGPLGRPDMAYFSFANNFFAGKPIYIYNSGDFDNDLYRDFTYIDDIVEGIERLVDHPPVGGGLHKVYNIGNNRPEKLMVFIESLEKAFSQALGHEVRFEKIFEPIKPGDVPITYASTDLLQQAVGFKPMTHIDVGLQKFAEWYVEYYSVAGK